MLIIIDDKMSPAAKKQLSAYGNTIELKTAGITYPAISGHPDIFFFQAAEHLIIAPNLPDTYYEQLRWYGIDYITGELSAGQEYPASARYNAVATDTHLIHNLRHTDLRITQTVKSLQPVHVDQGYCRCNLLSLKNGHFITSDAGIHKALSELHSEGLWVPPAGITLEGFPHGFFGGCCGVCVEKVFINGSLEHFPKGETVRKYLENLGYSVVELAHGPLVDTGSIFFLES